MTDRNGTGGNLIVAVIIAIVVGVVVYFLVDSKPVGETTNPTTTGAMLEEGTGAAAITGE